MGVLDGQHQAWCGIELYMVLCTEENEKTSSVFFPPAAGLGTDKI
jgi:hypothetical protein